MMELSSVEYAVTTALSQDPFVPREVRAEAQRFCDGEIYLYELIGSNLITTVNQIFSCLFSF